MRSEMARDIPPTQPGAEQAPLSLELLVHGVGGTTPQIMLNDPRITRLCGDYTAGIYRRTEDVDAEQRPGAYHGKPVPDAFSWSNLTSGDGSRALWLLLLPFMVANLAYWMRPAADTPGLRRTYDILVRIIALSLTVLLVAAVSEVAVDLVAWQCAGQMTCIADKSWLGWLAGREPGQRLAIAAWVPLGLTMLLWWLSHRTWYAYESQAPIERDQRAAPDAPPLAGAGFWYGRRAVARLRAAHTAVGLLTVSVMVLVPALTRDQHSGPRLAAMGWALVTLLAALAGAAVAVTWSAGRSEDKLDHELDRTLVRFLLGGSVTALMATGAYVSWHRPGWRAQGHLPPSTAFCWLTLLQGALVVALGVTAVLMHRTQVRAERSGGRGRADDGMAAMRRIALHGLGGPAVAVLACGLGGILTGGMAQRVADWLDRGSTPGSGGNGVAGPPVLLSWQASTIPLVIAVVIVVAVVEGRRLWQRTKELEGSVPAQYPGESLHPERTRQIAGAQARAGLTDSAPLLVGVTAVAAVLLGAGALAGAWASGRVPGEATTQWPGVLHAGAEAAQGMGSWLVGASVVAMVALGRRAYRSAGARRTVGILWDIGTFWPRAAHPFAPPCYAERAVPDLTWRMTTWTAQYPSGRIILSGHSQGTVLAAAAAWQLDPATRDRIALLTYGSPLERLYGRWFPAYFGPAQLRQFHGELRAWRNLWRRTDPIGGPVRICGGGPDVDCPPLKDPAAYGRTPAYPLPAPILTHFDYQADPAFAVERTMLLVRLTQERAPSGLPLQDSAGRSSG